MESSPPEVISDLMMYKNCDTSLIGDVEDTRDRITSPTQLVKNQDYIIIDTSEFVYLDYRNAGEGDNDKDIVYNAYLVKYIDKTSRNAIFKVTWINVQCEQWIKINPDTYTYNIKKRTKPSGEYMFSFVSVPLSSLTDGEFGSDQDGFYLYGAKKVRVTPQQLNDRLPLIKLNEGLELPPEGEKFNNPTEQYLRNPE
jgi:hypothetical protein